MIHMHVCIIVCIYLNIPIPLNPTFGSIWGMIGGNHPWHLDNCTNSIIVFITCADSKLIFESKLVLVFFACGLVIC